MIHTTAISRKNFRNHKIRRNHKRVEVEIRKFLFVGPNVQITLGLLYTICRNKSTHNYTQACKNIITHQIFKCISFQLIRIVYWTSKKIDTCSFKSDDDMMM